MVDNLLRPAWGERITLAHYYIYIVYTPVPGSLVERCKYRHEWSGHGLECVGLPMASHWRSLCLCVLCKCERPTTRGEIKCKHRTQVEWLQWHLAHLSVAALAHTIAIVRQVSTFDCRQFKLVPNCMTASKGIITVRCYPKFISFHSSQLPHYNHLSFIGVCSRICTNIIINIMMMRLNL